MTSVFFVVAKSSRERGPWITWIKPGMEMKKTKGEERKSDFTNLF